MIATEQAGSSSYAVWPGELRVSTHDIIGFVKTNARCSKFCPHPTKFAAYELKAAATGRMSWPLFTAPSSGCRFLSALNCAAFAPASTTNQLLGRSTQPKSFRQTMASAGLALVRNGHAIDVIGMTMNGCVRSKTQSRNQHKRGNQHMKKRDPGVEVGVDVIGDIHGYADHLKALLEQMGYRKTKGAYRHETRTAIFVGDLIDRGPKQVEVYRLVRDMCEAGSAQCVLGNHEYNAIGFATPHPETGAPLREHKPRNVEQHEAFLKQVKKEREPNLYEEIIDWFRILPVWIDRDDLRVVHACWHEGSRQALSSYVDDNGRFTTEGLMTALTRGTEAYDAVEILLKGPEVSLPNGLTFRDPQGSVRRKARVKWWDHRAATFRTALIVSPDVVDKMPDSELQDQDLRFAYHGSKPLFFGHYWLDEELHVKHESAVCLDYSIAKDGALVAYRWSGETKLQADNLHAVPKPTVGDPTRSAQPCQRSSVGGPVVG